MKKYDALQEAAKTVNQQLLEILNRERKVGQLDVESLSRCANAVPTLIADVKALAEALHNLTSEYRIVAFTAGGGFFHHPDHPAWLDARAALARIQGEA